MGHRSDRWNRSWLVGVLVLLVTGSVYHFHEIRPVPLERALETVPLEIGSWWGRDVDLRSVPFRIQGAHQEIARIYRNKSGDGVILYIGYFEFQEQGRELVSYLSRKLLLGASKLEILMPDGQFRSVKRTVLQGGEDTYLALFWYELSGAWVVDPYWLKLRTIWDGLARRKTNGAMVATFITLNQPGDLHKISAQGVLFVRELIPNLQNCLPI